MGPWLATEPACCFTRDCDGASPARFLLADARMLKAFCTRCMAAAERTGRAASAVLLALLALAATLTPAAFASTAGLAPDVPPCAWCRWNWWALRWGPP